MNNENQEKNNNQNKNSGKILVVEDDKFLRGLLVRKLESFSFGVESAVSGEEAVKKIKKVFPQLILLDLVLPGIDGFDVLREIKAEEKTKNIPVIILSNLGQKEEVERGLKLGAEDYMIKAHFTPDEIVEKVKKYIK